MFTPCHVSVPLNAVTFCLSAQLILREASNTVCLQDNTLMTRPLGIRLGYCFLGPVPKSVGLRRLGGSTSFD